MLSTWEITRAMFIASRRADAPFLPLRERRRRPKVNREAPLELPVELVAIPRRPR